DWRLAPYDIAGSRAHARVLHKAGLLTEDELRRSRMLQGRGELRDQPRRRPHSAMAADGAGRWPR
ncbi:hypothetical protein, partial [Streptomyces sp. NPDC046939]|uniref:hypothetical protein n=1 Tax=Streptomyces sp. NPDC046939 TaxID=3155376 RepID=UPI0033FA8A51